MRPKDWMLALAFASIGAGTAIGQETSATKAIEQRALGTRIRLTYPAVLDCPTRALRWVPEIAVRYEASGAAAARCHVDERGRISDCVRPDEKDAKNFYFPTAAWHIAEQCKVVEPPTSPVQMQFGFKFEMNPRDAADSDAPH